MHIGRLHASLFLNVVFSSVLAGMLWAKEPLCDFSPLPLQTKSVPGQLGQESVDVNVGGKLEFQADQNNIVTISEALDAKLLNAEQRLKDYATSEIASLSDSKCVSQDTFSQGEVLNTHVRVTGTNLVISVRVRGQQWGCLIGIKALVAEGEMEFEVTVSPTVEAGKLVFHSDMTHSGSIESTVPDFDDALTDAIRQKIDEGSARLVDSVAKMVNRIQGELDKIASEDPTEKLKPLYNPKVVYAAFSMQGPTLVFSQIRRSLAKEGTACKIRSLASGKWAEF